MRIPAFDYKDARWDFYKRLYNYCNQAKVTTFEDGSAIIKSGKTWNKPHLRKYYADFDIAILNTRTDTSWAPDAKCHKILHKLADPDGTKIKQAWMQEDSQLVVVDFAQGRVVGGGTQGWSTGSEEFIKSVFPDLFEYHRGHDIKAYAASPDAPLIGQNVTLYSPQKTPPAEQQRARELIQACRAWLNLSNDVERGSDGKYYLKEGDTGWKYTNPSSDFTPKIFETQPSLTFNDLGPRMRFAIALKGKDKYPPARTNIPYLKIV